MSCWAVGLSYYGNRKGLWVAFFVVVFLRIVAMFRNLCIFAVEIQQQAIMTQNVGLNQAQMDFLRLLAHFSTEEEVKELNDVVCEYYARKIDEEMDRLWDEGKWNNDMIEATLHEHLRTPYNA